VLASCAGKRLPCEVIKADRHPKIFWTATNTDPSKALAVTTLWVFAIDKQQLSAAEDEKHG
jgi:hypothetical protein